MQSGKGGRLLPVIVLLTAILAACGAPAVPQIRAEDVWSRPAVAIIGEGESAESGAKMGKGMGGTGAVFMVLTNDGGEADRLVGAMTDVAKVVRVREARQAQGLQEPLGAGRDDLTIVELDEQTKAKASASAEAAATPAEAP